MTPLQLNSIWRWSVLLCVMTAIDVVSSLQGGPALFGSRLAEAQNNAFLTIAGILILSGLLALATHAAAAYGNHRDIRSNPWHERLPPTFFETLDTRDKLARNVVTTVAFVAVLFPLIALTHCWFELSERDVLCRTGNTPHPFDLTAFADIGLNNPCKILDPGVADDDGVTWWPILAPVLLGLATLYACWSTLKFMRGIAR